MTKALPAAVALALLLLGGAAKSNVFDLGPGLTNLETVPIGDPGNRGYPFGAVSYSYHIGRYEVTTAQYCDFLNHKAKSDPYGLYHTRMADTSTFGYGCNIQQSGADGDYSYSVATDWANRPVNYVSFWAACRFVNWLNNGQGDGDTETGAYDLNGFTGADASLIPRNEGAKWYMPSENEWYKAAYYSGGSHGYYWWYPIPYGGMLTNVLGATPPYYGATYQRYGSEPRYTIGAPYYRTEVGAHTSSVSAYGTFDQAGNVWEWTEGLMYPYETNPDFGQRIVRGGSWSSSDGQLYASARYGFSPAAWGYSGMGFRVVCIPEPSSLVSLACGVALLVRTRRRKG